jgi:pSer/pThr/pTyr-binding forkhead associated (FHA) protein
MYRITVSSEGSSHGLEVDLDRDLVLVGRRAGCDVPLPHHLVAGVELRLERHAGQVMVVDPGAGHGVAVNGQALPIGEPRPLIDGDVLAIAGGFELLYTARSPAAQATTAAGTAQLARAMVEALLASMAEGGPSRTPWLEVVAGPARGRTLALPAPGKTALLGRGETCELVLADPDLSREHLRLERDLGGIRVTDLGSKNGTLRRGARLPVGSSVELLAGEILELGATWLILHDPAADLLAQLQAEPAPAPVPAPVPAPPPPLPGAPSRLPVVAAGLIVVAAGVGLVLLLTR